MASEIVPATAASLAAALKDRRFVVDHLSEGGDFDWAQARFPEALAEDLIDHLDAAFRAQLQGPAVLLPMPPDAPDTPLKDEELLAMQEILDALAPLDDAAVNRVLKWARARYGW